MYIILGTDFIDILVLVDKMFETRYPDAPIMNHRELSEEERRTVFIALKLKLFITLGEGWHYEPSSFMQKVFQKHRFSELPEIVEALFDDTESPLYEKADILW